MTTMSRRPHKKSRNGCPECKQRHIRCDQCRPVCNNCLAAEIRCSFLSKDEPMLVTEHRFPRLQADPSRSTPNSMSDTRDKSTSCGLPEPEGDINRPYNVNMVHLELFRNLSSDDFLAASNSDLPDRLPIEFYMQFAVQTPYLMHQVLATSALHMSTKCAQSLCGFYRDQATGLQTRALSLFNECQLVLRVTPKNAVEMFLFASILGVHLLCEPMLYHGNELQGFLTRFRDALSVCRGVLTVVEEAQHLLDDTELGLPLEVTRSVFQDSDPHGSECDVLQDLVSDNWLDQASQEACQDAVSHLRRVFNAQAKAQGSSSESNPQTQAVFAWPILLSKDFSLLLSTQEPHALVILAHYAILLHRGRHVWYFGGGRFLIESIGRYLGSEWQHWLTLPRKAIDESKSTP